MDKLLDYLSVYINLEEPLVLDLQQSFKTKHFKKGAHIQETDKTCKKLFFIVSGAVRTYYLQDGRDITSWIYPEGYFITTWSAFITGKKAFENIQAITDCELLYIDKDQLESLYQKHPAMERFGRILAEEQLAFLDEISHEFTFSDAKQRYDKLLEFFPDITRIAKLGHIASILGINQVTLSRIRKLR